jgi:hypothetical protein
MVQYGICSWDTLGHSLLSVFHILTLDRWSGQLFNLQNTARFYMIPTIFCCSLVYMGSFYLLNLMLAVVMESYIESE